MPRFRNYYNKRGKHNRIYSLEDLLKMSMGDFIDKENELDFQDNTIGLPFDDELKLSQNVRFIDGFTQDDGNVIPSRWESFAPVYNTQSKDGGITEAMPETIHEQFPTYEKPEPWFKQYPETDVFGEIKPYKNDLSKPLSKEDDKLPDNVTDVLKQQPQEDTTLSDDLLTQNKTNIGQIKQLEDNKTQNIQNNLPLPQQQPSEEIQKPVNQVEQTEQQEQPKLSPQLSEYIEDLLKNTNNLSVDNVEKTPTLQGYITNTPDIIESEEEKGKQNEFLDGKGKVHVTDENGNELKTDLSIWNVLSNKTKEHAYNIDSWINKPSSEMDKKKTEVLLNVLTAPLGIGDVATSQMASLIAPILGQKIAKYVADGIGNGIVSGTVEGIVHNIENDNNHNSSNAIINDILSNTKDGALDGYIQGQLNQNINPKNKNYFELLMDWLKLFKK